MKKFEAFADGCPCRYKRSRFMCNLTTDDCLEVDCAAYYAYKTAMEELMPGTTAYIEDPDEWHFIAGKVST